MSIPFIRGKEMRIRKLSHASLRKMSDDQLENRLNELSKEANYIGRSYRKRIEELFTDEQLRDITAPLTQKQEKLQQIAKRKQDTIIEEYTKVHVTLIDRQRSEYLDNRDIAKYSTITHERR